MGVANAEDFDNPASEAYRYWNGGVDSTGKYVSSIWDKVSEVYARDVKGAVMALVPFSDKNRIWYQSELKQLLDNNDVTHINGITISELRSININQGYDAVFERIAEKSQLDMTQFKYVVDSTVGRLAAIDTGNYLSATYGLDDIRIDDFVASQNEVHLVLSKYLEDYKQGKINLGSQIIENFSNLSTDQAKVLQESFKLGKLGTALAVMGLVVASNSAHSAQLEGNTQEASRIIGKWSFEFVSGLIGGGLLATGAVLATPAIAVGTLTAAVMTLGAGIVGGIIGADAGKEIYNFIGEVGTSIGNVLSEYNEIAHEGLSDIGDGIKALFNGVLDYFESAISSNIPTPSYLDLQNKTISVQTLEVNGVKTAFDYSRDGTLSVVSENSTTKTLTESYYGLNGDSSTFETKFNLDGSGGTMTGFDSQGNKYASTWDNNNNSTNEVYDKNNVLTLSNSTFQNGDFNNYSFNPVTGETHTSSKQGEVGYSTYDDGHGYTFEKTTANNTAISTEKLPDGKTIEITATADAIYTKTTEQNGSYQTYHDDLQGNIDKKTYRTNGSIQHAESTKADGTTSTTDYQTNGASDTLITNPDGTKVIIHDDGQNNKNSTYLNQNGSIDYITWNEGNTVGYEAHTLDTSTNITTKEGVIKYGNGEKTEYTNTDDGINETKASVTYSASGVLKSTYNYNNSIEKNTSYKEDGSSNQKTTNLLTGDYQTVQNDGQGNHVSIEYNAYHVEKKRTWESADGTKGEAQGNYQKITTPDKRFTISNKDAQGNHTTTTYTPNGSKLAETIKNADGTTQEITYNLDHSVRSDSNVIPSEQTTNENGQTLTKQYNDQGQLIKEKWINADGSKGEKTYYGDNSSKAITTDANGNVLTQEYGSDNQLKSDSKANQDGSILNNSYKDGIRYETWQKPDGTAGGGIFNPDGTYSKYQKYADGTKTEQSKTAQGLTSDKYNPDGSYRKESELSDGSKLVDTTTTVGGQITSRLETYHKDGLSGSKITIYGGQNQSPYIYQVDLKNGLKVHEFTQNADGSQHDIYYLPDDGGVIEVFKDKNGVITGFVINGEKLYIELEKIKTDAQNTVSPLVLDLNGDGISTISLKEDIHFDHAGDGFAEQTGWINAKDGFLVRDLNGNGIIDSGQELFGSETLLQGAKGEISKGYNGFTALAALDSNADGVIDENDRAFSSLQIWQDANSNGQTDAGELFSLSDFDIQSIGLSHSSQDRDREGFGNRVGEEGKYINGKGQELVIQDIWFKVDTSNSQDKNPVEVSEDIAKLANLQGLGNVVSLQQAIAKDATGRLKDLLSAFSQESDPSTRDALFERLLFVWTGVDNIQPDSRGDYFPDARQLAALEAFWGRNFQQQYGINAGTPNPGPNATAVLLKGWSDFKELVYDQLMLQTHFAYLLAKLDFQVDDGGLNIDATALVSYLETLWNSDAASFTALVEEFGPTLQHSGEAGKLILDAINNNKDQFSEGFADSLSDINNKRQSSTLLGDYGDNRLAGTSKSEQLLGGDGNDTLMGGAGNDTLVGGKGNDTYIFNKGDGFDVIDNAGNVVDGTVWFLDTIRLGAGITKEDLVFYKQRRNDNDDIGADLDIGIANTSDVLRVQDFFIKNTISAIQFADGAVWTRQLRDGGNGALYNGITAMC